MLELENLPIFIKNYLNLKGKAEENEFKWLNNIFSQLDKCELKSANVNAKDGLVLTPTIKEKEPKLNEVDKNNLLNYINNNLASNDLDKNSAYFYQAFITLIEKSDYITIEEQTTLNFLYTKLELYNGKIEATEEYGKYSVQCRIK